jgi:hypothetical protein
VLVFKKVQHVVYQRVKRAWQHRHLLQRRELALDRQQTDTRKGLGLGISGSL